MDPRVEAVARALCAVDGLDPEAPIAASDYAEGLRSSHHPEVAQWITKATEANRFIAAFDALREPSSRLRPGAVPVDPDWRPDGMAP